MKRQRTFVRNRRSSVLLERFLIVSVATVLVIRLYLAATHYPQVGGGGLHISHMLWGGLGMLIALVLSLAFVGRYVQAVVAILGGIGFGTFIDELGKFITSDNNYFFQPTLTLIYIIYIVMFLSILLLENLPYAVQQEHLAHAQLDLQGAELRPSYEQGKLAVVSISRYRRLADSPTFTSIIIIFFIAYALFLIVLGGIHLSGSSAIQGVFGVGWLASSLLSYIMIVVGLLSLRRSRLVAFIWLKRAVLVSIFLSQSFLVSMQPMSALVALLVNLIVLAMLNNFMSNSSQSPLNRKVDGAIS